MASLCGDLTEDILKDCDNPLVMGTRDQAKIVNFDDLTSVTRNATTGAIEAVTLASGITAVVMDGQKNSIVPRCEMVTVGVYEKFDHEVSIMGMAISPAIKKDLESGKEGRYIIFVENYFKGTDGNAALEVYGLDTGLELKGIIREPNNADTQGGFQLRFYTDLNKEPRLPASLFLTDYATSKAIYDGL